MKTVCALVLVSGLIVMGAGCRTAPAAKGYKATWSSFDLPSDHPAEAAMNGGTINFERVDVGQVLKFYEVMSGRTVIQGILPAAQITLRCSTPVSRVQVLQLFDTVLAQNGIVMILAGDHVVKAVPRDRAMSESPPNITLPWAQLPESSSFMMRTVTVKYRKPIELVPVLSPFSAMPNSIVCIDGEHLLVLRDYSANIRQELQLLEQVDQPPKR